MHFGSFDEEGEELLDLARGRESVSLERKWQFWPTGWTRTRTTNEQACALLHTYRGLTRPRGAQDRFGCVLTTK